MSSYSFPIFFSKLSHLNIRQTDFIGSLSFIGILIIYLITSINLPGSVFWSPDEGARYLLTEMISENPYEREGKIYQGHDNDPALRFYPGFYKYPNFMYPTPSETGRIISPWSLVFPFITGLVIRIIGNSGIYAIPLLASWIDAFIVWKIAKKLNSPYPYLLIILVGLGTPLYFYSQVFWEHSLATLFGLVAMYLVISKPNNPYQALFLMIIPLTFAIFLRTEMIAFALGTFIAFGISLIRSKNLQLPNIPGNTKVILISLTIAVATIIPLSLYSLPLRYLSEFRQVFSEFKVDTTIFESLSNYFIRIFTSIPNVLINSSADEGLSIPIELSWVGVLALLFAVAAIFLNNKMGKMIFYFISLVVLTIITLIGLFSIDEYRSLHGFFICAPYSVIVTYGFLKAWRHKSFKLNFLYLATLLCLLFGIGSILIFRAGRESSIWPGLEWGQRYLLTIYPLMAITSFLSLRELSKVDILHNLRKAVVGIAVILMIFSISIQVRGIWMLKKSKVQLSSWSIHMDQLYEEPFVTNEWWFPASLAMDYLAYQIYLGHTKEDFAQLNLMLKTNGESEFIFITTSPDWISRDQSIFDDYHINSLDYINGLYFIQYIGSSNPE